MFLTSRYSDSQVEHINISIIIITKVTNLEKTHLLEKKTVISYSLSRKSNSIVAIN